MHRVNVTPAASANSSMVAARIDSSVPVRSMSVARIMSAVMELLTINLLKEVGFRPSLKSNERPVPEQETGSTAEGSDS